ncbi:lactonase family protein [Streptomyces antimicrobicus]|uniref:Lactonase family protein n=1 Tax=Streptomyces antimicrobicus TaxID=2883108 RepID=A0ABS8B350_9ACTN|nr:lactonase family protein [Streptomyces antimicrobicus]MCB5179030.1 lactonase family protein [Streptomyces antimicrobicus]
MVEGGSARAYIGSFTAGGGRGITTAAVDPATGALTPLDGVQDGAANPSWLALAPGTGVLYAVSETDDGAVAAYRRTPEGLTPLGRPVPSGGKGPTHLSVAGDRLLVAHYVSGTVSSLPLGADGGPGGPARVLVHEGGGPDPERQQGPHAHQVLPDPSGRWVLSVDLGTDSVRVCALDAGSGALRLHAETALRAGSGPRHLAFHPDGEVVYVLHELEPQLTVCRWDPVGGQLVPVGEVTVLPAGAPSGARPYPSVPVVSPDGRFVRAAVRGADLVVTLSLADGAEKPQLVDAVECGGSWPRDLVADPSGRRLYVCNEWSGDVTWFDADPLTGRLRRSGRLEVPAAACLLLT